MKKSNKYLMVPKPLVIIILQNQNVIVERYLTRTNEKVGEAHMSKIVINGITSKDNEFKTMARVVLLNMFICGARKLVD